MFLEDVRRFLAGDPALETCNSEAVDAVGIGDVGSLNGRFRMVLESTTLMSTREVWFPVVSCIVLVIFA